MDVINRVALEHNESVPRQNQNIERVDAVEFLAGLHSSGEDRRTEEGEPNVESDH